MDLCPLESLFMLKQKLKQLKVCQHYDLPCSYNTCSFSGNTEWCYGGIAGYYYITNVTRQTSITFPRIFLSKLFCPTIKPVFCILASQGKNCSRLSEPEETWYESDLVKRWFCLNIDGAGGAMAARQPKNEDQSIISEKFYIIKFIIVIINSHEHTTTQPQEDHIWYARRS